MWRMDNVYCMLITPHNMDMATIACQVWNPGVSYEASTDHGVTFDILWPSLCLVVS